MNQQRTQPERTAFTLMELMVVLVIIALIGGVVFPVLVYWVRSSRREAGMNSVAAGVKAARGYAPRTKAPLAAPFDLARYDGVAILFTPAGEMRLVENDRIAIDQAGSIVEPDLNAYSDIPDRDYIQLPKGTGVAGITKAGVAGDLQLLPPPFAIRFDVHGRFLTGSDTGVFENRLVFYNSDYDNDNGYLTSGLGDGADREDPYDDGSVSPGAAYVPAQWDPQSDVFDPVGNPQTAWNEAVQKWPLPFDRIETVVGIIVYSKYDFEKEALTMPAAVDAVSAPVVHQWLLDNGQAVFFSRYTGALITKGE